MLSTLTTVIPIFALIFAGWLVRRMHVLGPHATSELNRFVVYLALPALLFDVIAHTEWASVWLPGFILTFGLASAAIFALTLIWRRMRQPLADAALDGLNAGYANTGFMGFPLALVVLGKEALPLTTITLILTVCAVFALAILAMEIGMQEERHPLRLVGKVARSLATNPLLVAPFLGALVPLFGLTIPAPAETFLKLLGGAASPCALVALGLFLAEPRERQRGAAGGHAGVVTVLVALKLLAQPLLTWVLAEWVFDLTAFQVRTAVMLAALPTGTGPFMLAEYYRRDGRITSDVILYSTILSVLTVSGYLAFSG